MPTPPTNPLAPLGLGPRPSVFSCLRGPAKPDTPAPTLHPHENDDIALARVEPTPATPPSAH